MKKSIKKEIQKLFETANTFDFFLFRLQIAKEKSDYVKFIKIIEELYQRYFKFEMNTHKINLLESLIKEKEIQIDLEEKEYVKNKLKSIRDILLLKKQSLEVENKKLKHEINVLEDYYLSVKKYIEEKHNKKVKEYLKSINANEEFKNNLIHKLSSELIGISLFGNKDSLITSLPPSEIKKIVELQEIKERSIMEEFE